MQLTLRLMNELIGSDGEDSRSRIYLSYYGGYTSLIATSLHRLARVFFVFVGAESRVREERGLKVFPIRFQIASREPLHRLSQPLRPVHSLSPAQGEQLGGIDKVSSIVERSVFDMRDGVLWIFAQDLAHVSRHG